MFLLNIKIASKNKKSLKNFLRFTTKLCNKKNLRLNLTLIKYLSKKKKHNRISVLTSPNANKNAQEQFFFETYSKQTTIFTFKIKKFLVLLKKLKLILFSDVKIKLWFFFTSNLTKKIVTKTFNPENFKTKFTF